MDSGKNRQPLGYTIVEVMIVLAVSALMFLAAVSFISGKEESTSFYTNTHEMASNIQDIINQVIEGKYTDTPISCINNGSTLTISNTIPPGPTQADCTFVGKFIYFSDSTNARQYDVVTLAGARQVGGEPPTSLGSDLITAVSPPNTPDLTVLGYTPESTLTVTGVYVSKNGKKLYSVTGLGFAQNLGAVNSDGGGTANYVSGAQTVSLIYDRGLASGDTEATIGTDINTSSSGIKVGVSGYICVTDGLNYAEISLGSGNGTALSALVEDVTSC
jgi:hypothetical protein